MGAFFISGVSLLVPYKKPYLNGSKLCEKLKNEGLIIHDESFAAKLIEKTSYYRFKAYLVPFYQAKGQFKSGTHFEQPLELYLFDEELRLLIFNKIQKLEICIRSQFDQWMTKETNNPFWYLDASLFDFSTGTHADTVGKVRKQFEASSEQFAEHFRNKYHNDYCPFYRHLPPSWVAIELMSFGNVVSLMDNLTDDSISQFKLDRLAQKRFGVQKFKTLCSNWMYLFRDVRNICGHHSRLFNRNLQAPAAIAKQLSKTVRVPLYKNNNGKSTPQYNRLYSALIAMQIVLSKQGVEKMGGELNELFKQYPIAENYLAAMGFPINWQEEPLLTAQAPVYECN